jgi:hypothetical protein
MTIRYKGKYKFKKSEIINAVKKSNSYRSTAKILGIGNQTVKNIISFYEINTDHFTFGKLYASHIGKTYNNLTIIKVYKNKVKDKRGSYRCYCVCDCLCGSKNVHTRIDSVISGHIYSCGCKSRNRLSMIGSKNPAFNGVGEIGTTIIDNIKRGAVVRNLKFTLTKRYLWNLFKKQKFLCKLSGIPLCFGRKRVTPETTASLDRIDSSKGYVRGNVQWVHKGINKMKQDLDNDYFIALCIKVAENLSKK